MTAQRDLEALDKLLASRGWELIKAALEDDILRAALAMAKSSTMSTDELHFRRGAIYACSALVSVPSKLREQLHAEVTLKNPAKAGSKEPLK